MLFFFLKSTSHFFEQLLSKKLIVHVSHKKTFKNGNYFYQFSNFQRVSKSLFMDSSSSTVSSPESSQPNTPEVSSLSNSPVVKFSELAVGPTNC